MVIYLVLLFILWYDYFGLRILTISHDEHTFFLLLYIVLGMFLYRKRPRTVSFQGKLKLWWLIVAGIALSTITCYLFWGQSFFQSVLTYKEQYTWILIPALFAMSPQEKDLMKALKVMVFLLWAVYIGKFVAPSIFMTEENLNVLERDGDITVFGYEIVIIPFCYYLQQMREKFNLSHLCFVLLIFVFVFYMQNRSTLFAFVLFLGITSLLIKSKYRLFILVGLIGAAFLAYTKTADSWTALIDETQDQMGDEGYARNLSYAYFLSSYSPHWLCKVFGNGFISANTSSIFADLLAEHITQSDVGFIGFWSQFGLIPIFSFIMIAVIAFRVKKVPYYLKLVAAFTIICSPTISYYGSHYHSITFILLYYLLFLHLQSIYNENGYLKCPKMVRSWIC